MPNNTQFLKKKYAKPCEQIKVQEKKCVHEGMKKTLRQSLIEP